MTFSTASTETGLVIDGERVPTGNALPIHDPARPDTVVGSAAAATADDAREAIAAAERAFPAWAAVPMTERAARLVAALDVLAASAFDLATTLTSENGKPLHESRTDLAVFDGRCRAACALGESFTSVLELPAAPFASRIHRVPVGVVTIIVPFNWPAAILGASLPYALVAGNAVVVKPPLTAPLALTRALEVLARELPPGVLNVVTGHNEAVEPMLTDPRVQHVVFTGSTSAGRTVMSLAAKSLAGVTLELGGNDPAVLLDDVDLTESAVNALATAAFMTAGQVCMAVKRVYVPRPRYAELVDGLSTALAAHRLGHGLDPATTMGPLHSARQRDLVAGMLAEARAAGTQVREFGSGTTEPGHFLRPALVLDPPPDLAIVTEEQFGPALPILPYDDLDAVVAGLNSEWSGLGSSVWSADTDRAQRVAAEFRTGTTWINQASASACDDRAPFGGFRQSGLGRELGLNGLTHFMEEHVVTTPA